MNLQHSLRLTHSPQAFEPCLILDGVIYTYKCLTHCCEHVSCWLTTSAPLYHISPKNTISQFAPSHCRPTDLTDPFTVLCGDTQTPSSIDQQKQEVGTPNSIHYKCIIINTILILYNIISITFYNKLLYCICCNTLMVIMRVIGDCYILSSLVILGKQYF